MDIIEVALSDLKPYENNPRKNDDAVDAVKASIKEFGFKVPIVVDKNNVIVAGHTRYKAAMKLGLTTVPVVVADDLTDQQVKAFRLADNKVGELAKWDDNLLELEILDIDMDMMKFGFDNIKAPIDEPEEDVIPEPPEEPRAQMGDIYILGQHRLICGDSTSLSDVRELMDGQLCDLVITDPPYNMNYQGAGNSTNRDQKKIMNDHMSDAKFEQFLEDVYECYYQSMKNGSSIYVFYKELGTGIFMRKMVESGLTYKQELIWVKSQLVLGGSKYQSLYEPFLMGCKGKSIKKWYGGRKQTSVIENIDLMTESELRDALRNALEVEPTDVVRANKQLVDDLHPTMKPIKLLEYLIKNSSAEGDIILDLFGGSGSTLIACEQTNRKCYMCELDPKYVDVIIKRWENLTGQKAKKLEVSASV